MIPEKELYQNDKRITHLDGIHGKTIERAGLGTFITFLLFTDGSFIYGEQDDFGDDGIFITFDCPMSKTNARTVGLLPPIS